MKKAKTIIFYSLSIIIALTIIDSIVIKLKSRSFFSIPIVHLKDGGTTVRYGLIHQVIEWKQLSTQTIDGKDVNGYLTGFEINYLPFYNMGNKDGLKPGIKLKFTKN